MAPAALVINNKLLLSFPALGSPGQPFWRYTVDLPAPKPLHQHSQSSAWCVLSPLNLETVRRGLKMWLPTSSPLTPQRDEQNIREIPTVELSPICKLFPPKEVEGDGR